MKGRFPAHEAILFNSNPFDRSRGQTKYSTPMFDEAGLVKLAMYECPGLQVDVALHLLDALHIAEWKLRGRCL